MSLCSLWFVFFFHAGDCIRSSPYSRGLGDVSKRQAQRTAPKKLTNRTPGRVNFPQQGKRIYVDDSAAGASNGLSWTNAFPDLQLALQQANAGDSIWVAAGFYVPAAPGGLQSDTFQVPSGVKVYGGFDGTETQLGQRDAASNVTILSGDINRDDTTIPVFNITTGNSWNIVSMNGANPDTHFEGFEFQTGHLFSAPFARSFGAGMRLLNSSPTIVDCSFSFCVATGGGAIFTDTGSPVIQDCYFSNNIGFGTQASGGAIRSEGGTVRVERCNFVANQAQGNLSLGEGGAIFNELGTMLISDSTFLNNTAFNRGNAGFTPSYGGAAYSDSGLLRIEACNFQGNQSNVGGAVAVRDFGGSSAELLNCVFNGNGVLPILLSNGLESGGDAGTIYSTLTANVDLIGCVIYGGSADNTAGARLDGPGRISNCIFWNNTDKKGNIGRSQVNANLVEYSIVMNMLVGEPGEDPPDPAKFPNSIDMDPLFTNAFSGDFHLLAGSPSIDAGDNSVWPAAVNSDLDGNARFVDDPTTPDTGIGPAPVCDMGAYEFN